MALAKEIGIIILKILGVGIVVALCCLLGF